MGGREASLLGSACAELRLNRGGRSRKEERETEAGYFFQVGSEVGGLWTREQGGKRTVLGLDRQ